MNDLLEKWNSIDPLTDKEIALVNMVMSHIPDSYTDWDNTPLYTSDQNIQNAITKQYFDLMLGSNINTDTHRIIFNKCCSDFIRELFKIYVDDQTLVISSDCEHPSVKDCLANCKNVLILDQHKDIRKFNLNKVREKIKSYSKIFVYIISVRNDTGEITPQSFMKALKEVIKDKQHTIVLDAVQGMFLMPCDYSMYDYVLGTGHVIVPSFNMGIAICKKEDIALKDKFIYNWSLAYLQPLKIVLKRLEKLYRFRDACNEYFKDFITPTNVSQACSVPYIFYIQADHAKLNEEIDIVKYHTLIMPQDTNVGGIRLRALGFISNPDFLDKAKQIMNYVLTTKQIDEDKIKEIL